MKFVSNDKGNTPTSLPPTWEFVAIVLITNRKETAFILLANRCCFIRAQQTFVIVNSTMFCSNLQPTCKILAKKLSYYCHRMSNTTSMSERESYIAELRVKEVKNRTNLNWQSQRTIVGSPVRADAAAINHQISLICFRFVKITDLLDDSLLLATFLKNRHTFQAMGEKWN